MFYRIMIALLSFLALLPLPACQKDHTGTYEASYESLGVPLSFYYEAGRERTPWELTIYDDKLFVASGDYDKNAGPVHMMQYDLHSGLWSESGILPDEQAERFVILNDTLAVPGTDPKADWSMGNYYTYSDGQWHTQRAIPGGIHTFDLLSHNGIIFAGIGVPSSQSPIAASFDGGKSFQQLPLLRDGIPACTTLPTDENGIANGQIRVYELFTLQNEVYAFYCYRTQSNMDNTIYRYENQAFHYVANLPDNVRFNSTTYQPISAETEFRNRLFFTTGYLYVTDDMQTATQIEFGDRTLITDLKVFENRLYCTAVEKMEDGQYRTSLWCNPFGLDAGFMEVFYFYFPSPAQCFTYNNNVFYFGMGDGLISNYNDCNGTILAVDCLK